MKIKVCGMQDADNLLELIKLDIDYIGFIFYNKSKRFVTDFPKVAIPKHIKKVGVFVNESLETVLQTVEEYGLDAVQLHGGESVDYCHALRHVHLDNYTYHRFDIIKVFSVDEKFDFKQTEAFEACSDLFLFDTKGKFLGGNGVKFNWDVLGNYKGDLHYLLSGGISLQDADTIKGFMKSPAGKQCIGVDLNSGFEIKPGLKNIKQLKEFKEIIKN